MIVIEYKGEIYRRNSNKWFNKQGIIVNEVLQKELNFAYSQTIDLTQMSIEELILEGDKFKESSSYLLAIKYYEKAVLNCDRNTMSYILPRISSCYRKCNKPQKAINLFSFAKKKYGTGIITSALLTTASAAYCDLGEYDNAITCCKLAYSKSGKKIDSALRNVIRRIEKENFL